MSAPDPSGWRAYSPAADHLACPFNRVSRAGDRPLMLTVQHYPAAGICVVVVDGELDMRTAPLLETCVHEQLTAVPAHLILELEPVRFLGVSGLAGLLKARELAQHTTGSQLHLAGLGTRVVARSLEVTGLRGLFDTYPTLMNAVVALAGRPKMTTSGGEAPAPVLAAMWCSAVGTTWTVELREFNRGAGLGKMVKWISSGVPVTQPTPDGQARELLSARGLHLFRDSSADPRTASRHRIGYACADTEVIELAHLARNDAAKAGLHPRGVGRVVGRGRVLGEGRVGMDSRGLSVTGMTRGVGST